VQEIDSAIDIFARADDRFSLDRIIEEDELSTATPIYRTRGISYDQDEEKFTP
jgi:methyl coenzyme M reductase gamma subunit